MNFNLEPETILRLQFLGALFAWGGLGALLRVLSEYKSKTLVQLLVLLIVGTGSALIVGNLLSFFSLPLPVVLGLAACTGIAADLFVTGILSIGKSFSTDPLSFIKDLFKKKP